MIQIEGKYCKDLKIFTDNIEEDALALLYDLANSRMSDGHKIRIMPDVHLGKGIVIGYSCPVSVEKDFINPEFIGVDIGCGVEMIFFDKPLDEKKYPQFERKIRREIPTGFNIHKTRQFEMKEFIKFVNSEIQKAYQTSGGAINFVEFNSEDDFEKWCKGFGMDFGTFIKSIGTLGSGNHMCEYDVNEDEKKYGFMVHTGSRNLGKMVCQRWVYAAKGVDVDKEAREAEIREFTANFKGDPTEIPDHLKKIREKYRIPESNGYLSGDLLKGYLTDMVIAQAYAKFNRMIILRKAEAVMNKINGAKVIDHVASIHNYLDFGDMTIRKGSIRAYNGEKMIIPFNMKDGLAICEGKSNEDWNCSAPHGAGRIMSRSQAKKKIDFNEFQKQMSDAGIYSTSVCQNTLDEAPDAYKPMDEIVELIQDTCDIQFFMKPKINIKATDGEVKYGKK
jgi:RNA-splicing ligase RtcB